MPNWVRNRLTIEDEQYEKIIKEICDDEEHLDFNKIVPMPESLHIMSGPITDECMNLFLNSIKKTDEFKKYITIAVLNNINFIGLKDEEYRKKLNEALETLQDSHFNPKFFECKTHEDVLKLGRIAFDNLLQYGEKDWYDWSISNWGTKWNADTIEISGNTILFETAWDPAIPAIKELSKKYPEAVLTLDFADEQVCVYCGNVIFKNNEIIDSTKYEDFSKLAYEQGFDLWDCKQYYKFDKKKNTYVFGDEDTME